MSESLSIEQARKLVLLSQKLPTARQSGAAAKATLSAIEHLGYIQIDAISVIERAHHHTLWNRNPRYKSAHLDQLLADKQVFEYWSHAAAYLPMRDYRFSLVRKQALSTGKMKHWFTVDEAMMKMVLKRIESEGPLMARDFEHKGDKIGEWKTRPAKRALEVLFMQGDLMVPRRSNFHKVYDLTERVLPDNVDTTPPEPEEYARYLIWRYLRANGLGRPAEMAYLLKNTKPLVATTLEDMVSSGELQTVRVDGDSYYAMPESLKLLSKPLARSKLKILSPFDNLVIQRKRMQALFGFDYLIECYVPEAKRKYGYFCLPILWDGMLVARMDCKVDRDNALLLIQNLALESSVSGNEAFLGAFEKELQRFLKFNNCEDFRLLKTSPAKVKRIVQKRRQQN
ncbi:winged helix-turn-helix domain-containing protein [Mariniblastus fucicola]|uniref:Winged helix DNA-binding domain-containing protein n=1 Tax=Mariniblastus fucicola TaxID=980251 RepID=A0A5B9PBE2_9BACT|nr:winged helix DNA-binding domain-containing protein [Mariniblastus fucicola]QEG23614.1 hypothetical protein MFFC18_35150 [Mariniblastus fucicola]